MKNLIVAAIFQLVLFPVTLLGAEARLDWLDNSADETGFKVDRQLNGGAWITLSVIIGSNVRQLIDATVIQPTAPGSVNDYCYRVYAVNATGSSPFSNVACKKFLGPPQTVPNAPSNLTTAAAGRNDIDVSWQNNNDPQIRLTTELTRTRPDGQEDKRFVFAGRRSSFTDTKVPRGAERCYQAQAVAGFGSERLESDYSNQSCATAR